jgi:TonB dependent receptor-like, beta-barrel/Carboxypeptidase regulatory-like domain/TonB-dependent Receptor Plug Domain
MTGSRFLIVVWFAACLAAAEASAQTPSIASLTGTVRDVTGGALPGVTVDARGKASTPFSTVTDAAGQYRIDNLPAGAYQLTFTVVNFASVTRSDVVVGAPGAPARVDIVMRLALSADVTVTGKTTFANLADAENPAENLVGIALSASQGAVTAQQLDARPTMRTGEVLETVPGVVISQHSGEGKANQYYLRGFNLDHGTDFATTVAGMPVNMPSHGHGQGYSDLNFMIPELVSGVQFSKGPYYADQGDFATAGAANINYVNSLDKALVRVGGGDEGYGRALVAVSPKAGSGRLLGALEIAHDDGPWVQPDDYQKVNGVLRYSRGDTVNGLSLTGMGYHASWNSTDQIPQRAVAEGLIGRFGGLDPADGGDTCRYSASFEWQRTRGNAVTKVTAYGVGYDLRLFSNFTFLLDDPERGDQFEQTDHRFVSGVKVNHRRIARWGRRSVQNTFGVQLRNDDITNVGLFHTQARRRLDTTRDDAVVETSAGVYAQNEIAWTPRLRTMAGLRVDGYHFSINPLDGSDRLNGGRKDAGLASPKGGVVIGPFNGTEFYVNGGFGFHSNDARGTVITRDPKTGEGVDPVTPLARATGLEGGVRTVAFRGLQSSVSLWSLSLDSELVFVGDAGTTEAGRPSHRYGVEWANYYRPRPWLIVDGDLALSRAHFTDVDPTGERIPGSVEAVVSLGVTLDSLRNVFGSVRLRYFGPRPLVEDDSIRSKATSLVNLETGYRLTRSVRVAVDVFNLLNAKDSDIDYYYPSRLAGEPAGGVNDIHFHPALPRTARVHLQVGF